jgi:glucose/arabinose dehydrogenase
MKKRKLSLNKTLRHKLILMLLLGFVVLMSSCSSGKLEKTDLKSENESKRESITTESTSGSTTESTPTAKYSEPSKAEAERAIFPPVEKEGANTDYKPLFAAQTRASGTKTNMKYNIEVLSENLNSPWGIALLQDGRLIITEKAGNIRLVSKEGVIGEKIGGFPKVDFKTQGGLLDVAPSPDFETSRMLYFTLAESTAKGSLTAVGKGRLADDKSTIENFEIIWRAYPYYDNSMHFGSRLIFDADSNLFVTTGERSDLTTRPKAQQLDSAYGKIIHITTVGEPVEDNPFVGEEGVLPEIYSLGHRNVQGIAFHPVTGDIWISEMGPRGGDELNVIKPGLNYGWPVISYGIEYSGRPIPGALTVKEGMEQPVYYWDPVLAPSGMTFYTADLMPEWKNNLFICGLKSQHIARLIIENDVVVAEERILEKEEQRFRDICEGAKGDLYAITDEGRLYRISP